MMQYKGPLLKWTNVVNGWQYRYCVLQMDVGILSYYLTKRNAADGNRKGCVRLKNSIVGIDDEVSKHFTITDDTGRTLYFEGETLESKDKWVKLLQNTIAQHSVPHMPIRRVQKLMVEKDERDRRQQWAEKFDTSIREADEFFQLVDKTRKQLNLQITSSASVSSSGAICAPTGSLANGEVNNNICSVKTTEGDQAAANAHMLQEFLLKSEEFMHAVNDVIINLQIAKNNVFSEEHIRTESLDTYKMAATTGVTEADSAALSSQGAMILEETSRKRVELDPNEEMLQVPLDLRVGDQAMSVIPSVMSDSVTSATQFAPPTQDVSFSEDELSDDQFFDANELVWT